MNADLQQSIKVTVYVTCRNYGRFLSECLESIATQSFGNWELLVFDEGSTDESAMIANEFVARYPSKSKYIHHSQPKGLRACANEALRQARGQYIIRLDADDYLDENAFLVLSSFLDQNPDIGLVYPNWIYVDEDGGFMGIESRKKAGVEDKIGDLPAHGACTMVRKRVLKTIGGYDESYDSQDGHELWMKVLHRFRVGSVQTPLFSYRQHGTSMSRDQGRLLNSRQKIKRDLAQKQKGEVNPRIVAIVPAKNTYAKMPNIALNPIAGKPLIDYTIEAAVASGVFEQIYVTTDDQKIVDHCQNWNGVLAELRSAELSGTRSKLNDVLLYAVNRLEQEHEIYPDIIVLLSVHSPLRRQEHIQKAVDTLTLYNVDNVISTYEDVELHFLHGQKGLQPLNPGMLNTLRFEREALYVDNGSVHAFWREYVTQQNLYQGKIGHIVMTKQDSLQIKSLGDTRLAEMELVQRASTSDKLAGKKK